MAKARKSKKGSPKRKIPLSARPYSEWTTTEPAYAGDVLDLNKFQPVEEIVQAVDAKRFYEENIKPHMDDVLSDLADMGLEDHGDDCECLQCVHMRDDIVDTTVQGSPEIEDMPWHGPRGPLVTQGWTPNKLTGYSDLDEFLEECFETMRSKGQDYRQGNADLLHNFRSVGAAVGEDPMKVWFTYFYKHYAALVTYIQKGGQSESEPIDGRIKDMIVYLILFYRMTQERGRAEHGVIS